MSNAAQQCATHEDNSNDDGAPCRHANMSPPSPTSPAHQPCMQAWRPSAAGSTRCSTHVQVGHHDVIIQLSHLLNHLLAVLSGQLLQATGREGNGFQAVRRNASCKVDSSHVHSLPVCMVTRPGAHLHVLRDLQLLKGGAQLLQLDSDWNKARVKDSGADAPHKLRRRAAGAAGGRWGGWPAASRCQPCPRFPPFRPAASPPCTALHCFKLSTLGCPGSRAQHPCCQAPQLARPHKLACPHKSALAPWLARRHRSAHLAVPHERLHLDQVHHAHKRVLLADGQLDGHGVGAQVGDHLRQEGGADRAGRR